MTGLVVAGGISANWLWWCWAIGHVATAFLFARMWRRSGVITDAEITELRYDGKPAAALRAFKAIFYGVFINCLTMAWVIAAMVKISRAFFDVHPALVIAACVGLSVVYTSLGGFRSVVVTDFLQFILGMTGALLLALFVTQRLGGWGSFAEGSGLLGALARATGPELQTLTGFVPAEGNARVSPAFFVVLLLAGWWQFAEGGGFLMQRLAACRDDREAERASLWFAVAHNALRPWPWIVVGLASMVVFPALADPEMGYPLMMKHYLPAGLLGLTVASLLAAFMSTIDTHTNWGASYLIRDIYQRFIEPDASEARLVWLSRGAILVMAVVAGAAALIVQNIATVWQFLITLGAGLGSVSALRWLWPRVTAWAELAALAVVSVAAIVLLVFYTPTIFGTENPFLVMEMPAWKQMLLIAGLSLATWIPVSLFGPQNRPATLAAFARRVRPPGPGWRPHLESPPEALGPALGRWGAGVAGVYGLLFGIGGVLLGNPGTGALLVVAGAVACTVAIIWSPAKSMEQDSAGRE